ncbi:phage/plasmid primase, P4 family [Spiribacter sp. 221]|uniref:phage/plasmid primase, P4 family n=1 Tax=Spiribacter onubensis TaxID=3122420 RepID=UPI00349F3D3B
MTTPMETGSAPVAEARRLAEMGVPVFPVDPESKAPRVKGGFLAATDDIQQVEAWWRCWPDAGVGVPTGKNGGKLPLLVIDVDVRPDKNGFASLDQLGIEIPATRTHATPSGGRHYLFRDPGGFRCSADKLAPGVDVRADGGYIVWHPAAGWPVEHADTYAAVPWPLQALAAKVDTRGSCSAVNHVSAYCGPERDGHELNDVNRERVRDMLACIPPDCSRDEWRDVVWSVAALDWGDEGRALAEEWSRTAPSKFDLTDFTKVWGSYDADKGIGVGTLEYKARQHGFQEATSAISVSLASLIDDKAPGDILAGKVFAHLNRQRMLYVHEEGRWYRWTGDRWAACIQGEEIEAAKLVADRALGHAVKRHQADPNGAKRLLNWAIGLRKAPRLEAMLKLAQSEPEMSAASLNDFDQDPDIIGVRGGVLDLRSGQFRNATPADRITKQAGEAWNAHAACPQWLQFLAEIFQHDQEIIKFVRRAVGYSLTGHAGEERMFLCVGHGANGKSVFSNTLAALLADYHHTAPPSLLTRRKDDKGPSDDLAGVCGSRLLSINETSDGDRLAELTVKRVASREPIRARHLYQSSFTFTPTFTPWLRTNHKPIVTGTDTGIWRRIVLIPFERQFTEDEADPSLESRLRQELPGILRWAVIGAMAWYRSGLQVPDRIKSESKRYRTESDLLGQFLEECTKPDPSGRVEQKVLWQRWRTFCQDEGVSEGSKKTFTRRLAERGISATRSNGKSYYAGVVLP